MIPQECIDSDSAAQKLYASLYDLLGPEYKVIQHLSLPEKMSGSLFWIHNKQQSLFIYLSHADKADFSVDTSDKESIKNLLRGNETRWLLKLQESLLPAAFKAYKTRLAPILFIHSEISQTSLKLGIKSLGLYLLGKEVLENNTLDDLINKLLGQPCSDAINNYIRYRFSPETHLISTSKATLSTLKDVMLDENQEIAAKADIVLSKEKRRFKNLNLTGLNGGSSSGKTQALLSRAKLLRKLHPDKSILILSINEVSKNQLKASYKDFASEDNKTEILSFNQWCKEQLKLSTKLVYEEEVNQIIESLIIPRLKENGISLSTFLHELDFIHGRCIFYEKEYLKAVQRSQPYHLNKEHYPHIWKAVLTLKSELQLRDWKLWSELPQLLWDSLQNDPFKKSYDHILIDDAHNFSPISFDLMKVVMTPKTGQLFITQDPNQGLINPIQLWKDTGLDLRNHATRLNNHYNINPCILNAASSFYLKRLPEDTDKHLLKNPDEISKHPIPELLHFHSKNDERNRLLNEIKEHIQRQTRLDEILIITQNDEASKELETLIGETLKCNIEILNRHQFQTQQTTNKLKICNIMQAQGLTAPYVFIFGIQDLFENELATETGANEHQALVQENTRKLSMAMTRARKELTLFMTSEAIPDAFISNAIKTPTINSSYNAEVHDLKQLG